MGKGGCVKPNEADTLLAESTTTATTNTNANNTTTTATVTATTTTTRTTRKISLLELSTKTSTKECWIAYNGYVYDVTKWLLKHPGGIRAIQTAAGRDASSVMNSLHAPSTLQTTMKRIRKVGVLMDDNDNDDVLDDVLDVDNAAHDSNHRNDTTQEKKKKREALERSKSIHKDFDKLNQKLFHEGWYDPQPYAYWIPILRVFLFATVGMKLILWSHNPQFMGMDMDMDMGMDMDGSSSFSPLPFLSYLAFGVGCILCGLFFQNIAFMGHDAGHGSVSGNFFYDVCFGLLVGNAFAGIDVNWWKSTHYVHHSATNSLHDDPDIQHLPLLCFEERMAEDDDDDDDDDDNKVPNNVGGGNGKGKGKGKGKGRWSTYHGRFMNLDEMGKIIVPYQHWYFYPVMAVARVNLYIQSFIYLVQTCPFLPSSSSSSSSNRSSPSTTTEEAEKQEEEEESKMKEIYAWPKPSRTFWSLSLLSLLFFWWGMYQFFSQLPVRSALVSFLIIHMVAGILHVQILLSHVAMHYCTDGHGSVNANTIPNGYNEAGYYEWQALSTMDVDCPIWMDWFHGGLQFQLEHHLFPRVPRWRLRELCTLTDEIFAKYDVPVVRQPFIESNRMILNHMAKVGANVVKVKTS